MRNKRGITLISLIITIIILLILSGISISTLTNTGLVDKVREAEQESKNAQEKENLTLLNYESIINEYLSGTVGSSSEGNGNKEPVGSKDWSDVYTKTQKDNYTDTSGKKATIPAGFQVSLKTGETEIDTGLVVRNATDLNEFVWIPCTIDGANESITYARYVFTREGWSYNQTLNTATGGIKTETSTYVYTETMPNDEESSIRTYDGFYIGRYESGVYGYDEEVSKTNSGNSTDWTGYSNGRLVIKANQQVWNYITRDRAKNISEGLYSKEKGDSVNSKLCSSFAWDTALKFIDTKNVGYSTYSTVGNYLNRSDELGKPAKTGLTAAVNNIYDMGGNTGEWTTEAIANETNRCSIRGGDYGGYASYFPAAYRSDGARNSAHDFISFRATLYL